MELNELKNLWQEESNRLKSKIEINEKRIRKMNMDKLVGELDKLVNFSILGRNLAFIYFLISLWMSVTILEDFKYSIPCFLGGLLMLGSFIHHLSIRKPEYFKMSLIELQKFICSFRVHTASSAKYDIFIVLFWLVTLNAVTLRNFFQISIYDNHLILKGVVLLFLVIVLLVFISQLIYKKV